MGAGFRVQGLGMGLYRGCRVLSLLFNAQDLSGRRKHQAIERHPPGTFKLQRLFGTWEIRKVLGGSAWLKPYIGPKPKCAESREPQATM